MVPSYPDLEVSDEGRVCKLPYEATTGAWGHSRRYVSKPTYGYTMRANKNAARSYRGVHYRSLGSLKVHQLVCEAFHGPKPTKDSVVIHIDEDAHNNRADNLKWGTQKENLNMPKVKAYHRAAAHEKFGHI